jgi:hypothetical protein
MADALALTFSYEVISNLDAGGEHRAHGRNSTLIESDYDPLEYAKVA